MSAKNGLNKPICNWNKVWYDKWCENKRLGMKSVRYNVQCGQIKYATHIVDTLCL